MKYHCGHNGCDVCGAGECRGANLKHFGIYTICTGCLATAVKVAVNMAETFGGCMIDASRKCGDVSRAEAAEQVAKETGQPG